MDLPQWGHHGPLKRRGGLGLGACLMRRAEAAATRVRSRHRQTGRRAGPEERSAQVETRSAADAYTDALATAEVAEQFAESTRDPFFASGAPTP